MSDTAAPKTYLVIASTSTRASPDPKSPAYESWVDWQPGETTSTWPPHAPVAAWVKSGHWQLVDEPKELR